MHSLDDLKHGYYINLEHRKDRRTQVEEELARIGLQDRVSRFNAVEMKNGRIGCTLSHLRCLEQAREQKLPHVLICEDDIHFLSPGVFTENLNKFLMLNLHWDVILLAGNNMPPYTRVNECCVKVTQCQTTTGYIVGRHETPKQARDDFQDVAWLHHHQDSERRTGRWNLCTAFRDIHGTSYVFYCRRSGGNV